MKAKALGYTVTLFLDAATHTNIEEFSSSNFVALSAADASGKRSYITPKSSSILPSVTNRSLSELAVKHFDWTIERRTVPWKEVSSFAEIAAVGTAVVITPVKTIDRQVAPPVKETPKIGKDLAYIWDDATPEPELKIDRVELDTDFSGFKALYSAYRQLQTGDLKGWESYNWMQPAQGI